MKKYKVIPLLLAAVLAVGPLTGCSKGNAQSSSSSSAVVAKLEGIAENEIKANISEEAEENETVFKLNGIIDSGMTDKDGNRYIYMDASISNNTDKEYDMNILNNFYVLFPDQTEAHFDVRTQLYAVKNVDNYVTNPFTLPAKGEVTGVFGGFLIAPDVDTFTVCFFPTQDELTNKKSVIKVDVTPADITKLTPAQ